MNRFNKFGYRKIQSVLLLSASLLVNLLFAQNVIVTENARTGNPASEWDISGAGDLSIQGFATDISVNKGQTVRFKINVAGAVSYAVRIYRIGYYQGNGARLISNRGSFQGTVQPAPITNTATGLVDCSNWSESMSWTVPANAVSGIYIAKLTRSDNNGASHVVFIVRDDAGNSPLLFKTADATWQSYNAYGGNSLYVGGTSYPDGHAVKVSYNRPFLTRSGGGGGGPSEDWLFNAEYPMIRWLERNGYPVSYTTDVDMDRSVTNITPSRHKVLLSVGHDEYWSLAERSRFENARNAGVHLAFFSGNEVYWKTRWENNHRTLVCYKEGTLGEKACGGKCDPTSSWTGLWRDGCAFPSSDGCRPENQLTGTISWYEHTGPITVPSEYKNLRFWRNTSVASLPQGQTATLPNGTLGYEWDYEHYEDYYPSGRITMSSTTVNGKTHKLSLYRHPGGALVFSAGTVQWSWGLDNRHDRGNAAASVVMQQATVNLFADMNVQPATLQAGLVAATASGDNSAPVTVINSPVNGASLSVNTPVNITGTANDAIGVIAGVEVSVDGGTTWKPANGTTNWSYSWTPTVEGSVTIKVRGYDDSGIMEGPGSSNSITVTVGNNPVACPCTIFRATDVPANPSENDGQGITLGVKFRATQNGNISGIRFYKGAGSTGTHLGTLWSSDGTKLAEATFTNESGSGWQQVLFVSPVAITSGTIYIASYFSSAGYYAVTDNYFTQTAVNGPLIAPANGEVGSNGVYQYASSSAFPASSYQASNYWVDVVFENDADPGSDNTPPVVSSTSPQNGATGVSVNTSVSAIFNEAIDANTVNSSTFELRNASNSLVSATVAYTADTKTATLTPTTPLNNLTQFTAILKGNGTGSGIKDLAGNVLAANNSWTFTTVAGNTSNCPCTIFRTTDVPAQPSENDGQGIVVGMKFRSTQNGNITGIRYYKGAGTTGAHLGTLWSSNGAKLAEATFANESASGWQQVLFTTPVAITAGVTYVASYFSSAGYYAVTDHSFNQPAVNGPLTALADGEAGSNGVYQYAASSVFPTQSYLASNYWVDVVFEITGNPAITEKPGHMFEESAGIGSALKFQLNVTPNPSTTYFNLFIKSNDKLPVTLRVLNILGEVLEKDKKVTPNTVLRLGQSWKDGIYLVEVIQGNQRQTVKVIKAK